MEAKQSATSTDRASAAPGRREFLRGSSLAVAALSTGSALVQKAPAQQTPSASSRPPAAIAGSGERQLFWVVETNSGKVQGISNAGIKEFNLKTAVSRWHRRADQCFR
ncbi:MAG: twin-arginine translocation signal domain-containing protein [Acidobacteriia bacterium]|nr:twin-arginine translocation signal domain-containing protein [Terriglobia bacterium]